VDSGILSGRHYLLVEDYNINRVEAFLKDYARQCEGESWRVVALKLSRIAKWEFEDYTP
jgi:hypothetical protein